jgi:hypothetical protein
MAEDYTIVFEKLAAASSDVLPLDVADATTDEVEEIAELRRAVLEIMEPSVGSYTTT